MWWHEVDGESRHTRSNTLQRILRLFNVPYLQRLEAREPIHLVSFVVYSVALPPCVSSLPSAI